MKNSAVPPVVLISCFLCFLLLFMVPPACTQKNHRLEFFSLSFDDDFFSILGNASDRSYTAGLKISLFHQNIKEEWFISRLLLRLPQESNHMYYWGASQQLFTPRIIDDPGIIFGDRPYASVMSLHYGRISYKEAQKEKISTEWTAGMIGPATFGKELHIAFHKLINDKQPAGWDNQIRNDIVINYKIRYEKGLLQPSDRFDVIGFLETNNGTVFNSISAGALLRTGIFDSYFFPEQPPQNKKQFTLYTRPSVTAVMDNTTLTGGVISRKRSPYTTSKDSLQRVYMNLEYGFTFSLNNFTLAYSEKLRTAEIKESYAHRFGSISLIVGLRKRNRAPAMLQLH